jgi:hypothetical protein
VGNIIGLTSRIKRILKIKRHWNEKHKTALLFDGWMEQIINHYGDEDVKRKIEFVKTFMEENFQVDDFVNSFIEIEKLRSKSLMWLLVSLIVDYETMKQNPNEHLSKLKGLGDSPSLGMTIPDNIGMQEKFKSLEVEDIFLVEELTQEAVEFIEKFLEKTNVSLESEDIFFIISTNQIVYLLRKIMKDYNTFLWNGEKIEG